MVTGLVLIGWSVATLVGEDGVDGAQPAARVPQAGARGNAPGTTRSFLRRLIPPPADRPSSGPRVPRSIADLARRLPLERKVAQLMVLGFRGRDLTAPIFRQLQRLDLGGMLIEGRNYQDPQQLTRLAGEARAISQGARHVPPLVLTSQEGGDLNQLGDLPPALSAAELRSPGQAARTIGEAAATLRLLGVTGLLGPILDIGPEDGGALGRRVFSDDPARVAAYATAVVRALVRERVLAVVAHFPGLGSAGVATDEGPAPVGFSREELVRRELEPFRAAVKAGAPAVLLGHGLYAAFDSVTPASLSKPIATDLLRRELRFDGVAITDDLAAPAVAVVLPVADAAVEALKAGADMVQISGPRGDQEAAYVALLNAVRSGEIPRARVDEALLRVLRAKQEYGLIR